MFSFSQIVPQPTVTLLRTFDPCHLSEYGTLGQDYGTAPGNQGDDSDRHSEDSDSDGEDQLAEVAANRLYETLEPPDLGDLGGAAGEGERTSSGAGGPTGSDGGHSGQGGKRPPAPRPRKNLPSAVKKINFGGPPKPPRNFNYALLGRDGDEADSEVCEKPEKAKGDVIKGKNSSKSKMKLQLEELGRLRVRGKRKDERKDSLKGEGEEEEDPSSRLAVENLYVTLPLPPSNESSPKKRSASQT